MLVPALSWEVIIERFERCGKGIENFFLRVA